MELFRYWSLFACLVRCSLGIAPPHQNYTAEFSQIVRKRRRLRSNPYRPHHIAPGHCWFLSDEDCRRDDEVVGQAKADRRLTSVGQNLKVLVLLIRFKDHGKRDLPDPSVYEEFFNGQKPGVADSSVQQYVRHSSLVSCCFLLPLHSRAPLT